MERLVFWPATVLQAIKRWRDVNNYDLEARVDGSESKGKMIRRLEFTLEILQHTPSRVWNGIFGIHDLIKIRCVTWENANYLDGMGFGCYSGSRIHQNLGTGSRIFCLSVRNSGSRTSGKCESNR